MTWQYLESILIFFSRGLFLGNVADSFLWASLSPWGYATRKVHWESHKAILPYSFTNPRFQFWEMMEMLFFSYIPNVVFFFFPTWTRTYIKIICKSCHKSPFQNFGEMFFSSQLYLPFKNFNVFIMVFNPQSSTRNRAWYFFQALPVVVRALPIGIDFLNDTERQDKQWVVL